MTDEKIWHKCEAPFIPRRGVNGRWTWEMGQTWRRRNPAGTWDYQQDEESAEDWLDRQV